ncbi:hypothetical protein G3578_10155 [Brevibacillus sp. SYP-B805]|uniref:hypothetical protein n=1 Tax=Brevibacillus sp. SYP-B805 TaxID=1578199 RepID=UPI0013ECFD56|nr:hypothetical protein [Brevibacillus sp. SYP-B805]NGQ95515.1 hypothetical protein [Brevibacillus sp. SYP-B805]
MAVLTFKVGIYARNIYLYGNERFTARDGYKGIPEEYHPPVKEYAATRFLRSEIDYALGQGWINQTEYDDTIALIPTSV